MKFLFLILIVAQVGVYGLTAQVENGQNLYCQKITAYFNGTFQNQTGRSDTFDAQMQVSAEINLSDKSLYFNLIGFNKNYMKEYKFGLFDGNFSFSDCDTNQTKCSIKYNNTLPVFDVYFYPDGFYRFWPWLIRINPLQNKRFTLLNAVGNCATSLQNNDLFPVDPKLYKSCFCCGDKYNPDSSLGCPTSPWS